ADGLRRHALLGAKTHVHALPDVIEVPGLPVQSRARGGRPSPVTAPLIVVAAAVIERDGRFLMARRLKGTHLEGLWEFPGGKCQPAETIPACLERELREELGVESHIGSEIVVTEHVYAERTVRLHFHACT